MIHICKNCGSIRKYSHKIKNELCKDCFLKTKKTHGQSKSTLYNRWAQMKQRCSNPKNKNFEFYGARGVKVCDEWLLFENFCKWSYDNGYDEQKQYEIDLDRIDSTGNYCPENCQWLDRIVNRTVKGHENKENKNW